MEGLPADIQYHALVGDSRVAKTLRANCVSKEVQKMIGNIDDLAEIQDTLDTCYERPAKYMTKNS
jgi:hypothetical protein